MTDNRTPEEEYFWEVAEPFLVRPGVSRSTMMGFPCLRIEGQFFAAFDRRSDDLVVKLPEARVDELVENGEAHTFAPAGRRFREWAAILPSRPDSWERYLVEALSFVADQPIPDVRKRQ